MTSGHAIINGIVGMAINFGLNLGAAYLLGPSDYMGIWRGYNGSSSAFWSETLLTSFLIIGCTTAIIPTFIHKELKEGKLKPVRDEDLQEGLFSCIPPLGLRGNFYRGFCLTLQLVIVLMSLSILGLVAYAEAGSCANAPGFGDQCLFTAQQYRFGKAIWAMLMSLCSYPFIRLATINRKNLPDDVYDGFLASSGVYNTSTDQFDSI